MVIIGGFLKVKVCDYIGLGGLQVMTMILCLWYGYYQTRRGLWPQAAFWVLCLICDKQIVDIFEMYPQRAQRAGGISKGSL